MHNHIAMYQSGEIEIEVSVNHETVWLNRQQLSELFGRDIKTIGKHITNVFKERELEKIAVVANFATTASDGKTYDVEYYNLDVIISVVKKLDVSHDRFLIIDDAVIYHIGASLKDLGKKWFAFSKMDAQSLGILERSLL